MDGRRKLHRRAEWGTKGACAHTPAQGQDSECLKESWWTRELRWGQAAEPTAPIVLPEGLGKEETVNAKSEEARWSVTRLFFQSSPRTR